MIDFKIKVHKVQKIWNARHPNKHQERTISSAGPVNHTVWRRNMDAQKGGRSRLGTFEMMCLRKIMGVTRLDKIRNTTIRKTQGMQFIILDRISQKRYFGHIQRMPTTRLPQLALYTQVHGNCPGGRPPKRWTECLLTDLLKGKITSLANATHLARRGRNGGHHEADGTTQPDLGVKAIE